MSISLSREPGSIHRLTVSGIARKTELEQAMNTLSDELGARGTTRLLIVLDRFTGFGPDNWSGLDFYAAHGEQIERIAIVGDPRWRDEVMLFALAGLRTAPVEFFVSAAISQARVWLKERVGSSRGQTPA